MNASVICLLLAISYIFTFLVGMYFAVNGMNKKIEQKEEIKKEIREANYEFKDLFKKYSELDKRNRERLEELLELPQKVVYEITKFIDVIEMPAALDELKTIDTKLKNLKRASRIRGGDLLFYNYKIQDIIKHGTQDDINEAYNHLIGFYEDLRSRFGKFAVAIDKVKERCRPNEN